VRMRHTTASCSVCAPTPARSPLVLHRRGKVPGSSVCTRCIPTRRTTPRRGFALSLAGLLSHARAAADVPPALPVPRRLGLHLLFQSQLPRGGDGAPGRFRAKAEPASGEERGEFHQTCGWLCVVAQREGRTWLAAARMAPRVREPAAVPLCRVGPLPRASRRPCVHSRQSAGCAAP
jgi:hypothetical protein